MKRPCGNRLCCTSTGIHDGLTYGSGQLDSYGFWSRPCRKCAVYYQKEGEEPNWPYKEEVVPDLVPPKVNNKLIGNSTSEEVVKTLFGSEERFMELLWDEDSFTHNGIKVVYDEATNVHWFFEITPALPN